MGLLDRFLNRVDTAGGVPILQRSNPLDWTRLSQTLFVSAVATLSIVYQTIIQATADAYAGLITGVTEFVAGSEVSGILSNPGLRDAATNDGLFGVIATETTDVVAAIWSNAFVNVPGFMRLPLQIVVLLVSFWIAGRAIDFVQAEVL